MTFLPKSTMFCRCWNTSSEVCNKEAQEGLTDAVEENGGLHTGCPICRHKQEAAVLATEKGEPCHRHYQTHWSFCPLSSQAHFCLLPRAPHDPSLCQEHWWIPPAARAPLPRNWTLKISPVQKSLGIYILFFSL